MHQVKGGGGDLIKKTVRGGGPLHYLYTAPFTTNLSKQCKMTRNWGNSCPACLALYLCIKYPDSSPKFVPT